MNGAQTLRSATGGWTRSIEASPQAYARIAGTIYLAVIIFGGFSEGFVMNTLIVSGNIAATARNISASKELWHLSVVGNLLVPLIAVVQLWIEYLLLRSASRNGALLFLLFNAASLAVEAVSKVFLLMVEPVLNGAGRGGPDQLHALVGFALLAHNIAFHVTLLLFGCACLVSGYLIVRSQFLPKAVGFLMQLAGLSYLIASWSQLFAPAFADRITPWVLLPALVGEASFCLWLLLRGVDVAKWRERLTAADASRGASAA